MQTKCFPCSDSGIGGPRCCAATDPGDFRTSTDLMHGALMSSSRVDVTVELSDIYTHKLHFGSIAHSSRVRKMAVRAMRH